MEEKNTLNFVKEVLKNMPIDWLNLTTHRLDIYNESLAKTEFLEQFEALLNNNNTDVSALSELPTAFDYIRLGHPLSCIMEWGVAKLNNLKAENVINFSSKTIPVLAILRKNLLEKKTTQIIYSEKLPSIFEGNTLNEIYGYNFELKKINNTSEIEAFNGSTILLSEQENICDFSTIPNVDFYLNTNSSLGSILLVTEKNSNYVSEIQHVRRRETIAMTPANTLIALQQLTGNTAESQTNNRAENKASVVNSIKEIT
ncbi:MAG: cystathionine beta-synthase, partial [Vicingaceae bacterium]